MRQFFLFPLQRPPRRSLFTPRHFLFSVDAPTIAVLPPRVLIASLQVSPRVVTSWFIVSVISVFAGNAICGAVGAAASVKGTSLAATVAASCAQAENENAPEMSKAVA